MSRALEFYYEFASTYSYLSVMRIEDLARARGVEISWRPFLLGPIFKAQGWTSSPFNIYPAKGKYMVRDISRIAGERGLSFVMPEVFPANGLAAARLATAGRAAGWASAFTRAVFKQQFAHGRDISNAEVLNACLAEAGQDAEAALLLANSQAVKDELRAATERAMSLGVFGAPSFVTDGGELFWGDDRLEQALAWALRSSKTE